MGCCWVGISKEGTERLFCWFCKTDFLGTGADWRFTFWSIAESVWDFVSNDAVGVIDEALTAEFSWDLGIQVDEVSKKMEASFLWLRINSFE